MAKPTDQFRARDVTFWAVFALSAWGIAVLSASVSAVVPDWMLAGLHASRLAGASLNQLRSQVANLESRAAELRSENTVLLQRFAINEQTTGEVTRRVGALELSIPRLVEAVNAAGNSVDNSVVTGSTGATTPVTTFDTDGGSVSYSRSQLPGQLNKPFTGDQPMPETLTQATPDASAFGIALGPPIDANEGAGAWESLNTRVGTLLIGLAPVLANVEGGNGKRLVAGPLASEADARELCGRMAKVGIACASVKFIGDPLPLLN